MSVWVYECMSVWVYECMSVRVYECMRLWDCESEWTQLADVGSGTNVCMIVHNLYLTICILYECARMSHSLTPFCFWALLIHTYIQWYCNKMLCMIAGCDIWSKSSSRKKVYRCVLGNGYMRFHSHRYVCVYTYVYVCITCGCVGMYVVGMRICMCVYVCMYKMYVCVCV